MAEFTMELNDEQKEVRDWIHGFAADVMRPAAAEWDEREETPWPVIQEAAKIGLYSLDFYAQQFFDPSGLGIPMAMEELFWGDAGIGLSIVGTGLAAVGVLANGTEEQIGTWVPQMYGDADDVKVAAFCSSEPDAGSDVAAMRTRAVYDEAKDEWVLNGTKTWATNGGIANVHVVVAVVDPDLGSKGHASFIVPPGTPGLSPGPEVQEARHPRLAHRRGRPGGRADPRPLPARRQGEARRAAGPRPGAGQERRRAREERGDGHLRGVPPGGRRHGGRHRARRVRGGAGVRQDPRAVRPADHRQPGRRLPARRHAHPDRRRPAAGLARVLDGDHRQALHLGGGLDVQALRERDRQEGHRPGRYRSSAATASPASTRSSGCTATRRSTPSSRAPARSSAWSSPGHCRACRSARVNSLQGARSSPGMI